MPFENTGPHEGSCVELEVLRLRRLIHPRLLFATAVFRLVLGDLIKSVVFLAHGLIGVIIRASAQQSQGYQANKQGNGFHDALLWRAHRPNDLDQQRSCHRPTGATKIPSHGTRQMVREQDRVPPV